VRGKPLLGISPVQPSWPSCPAHGASPSTPVGRTAECDLPNAADWTKRDEHGIRYYSVTAVYRKTFDAPKAPRGQRSSLIWACEDLAACASTGTTWRGLVPPWRVDITDAVKAGGNQLEIAVATSGPTG